MKYEHEIVDSFARIFRRNFKWFQNLKIEKISYNQLILEATTESDGLDHSEGGSKLR